jgi:hypothetical protein
MVLIGWAGSAFAESRFMPRAERIAAALTWIGGAVFMGSFTITAIT